MKNRNWMIIGGLVFAQNLSAQVGIGIPPAELTNEALQIKGDFIVTQKVGQTTLLPRLEEIKTSAEGVTTTTDYRVVAIDPSEYTTNGNTIKGQVKEMYGQQNVLPIIIQPYNILNVMGDDLTSLNLQIPSDEFYVAITNFEAIDNFQQGFGTGANKGRFEYLVFEHEGEWHVRIGNPHLSPANLENAFNYNFDILIYPNRFFKDLGEVIYTNVGQNGTALEAAVK